MRPISRRQKDDVLALLLQGLSSREIAERVGISHVSVQKIRKQSSHDIPIPTAGRPKRLTPEEAKRVARAVHVGRCKNARDAQRSLFHDSSSPPSLSTIRRALHDAGLKRYRRRKRPLLTKRHIRERLNFARQHAGWTAEDWKQVVWSDETKVNLYGPDGDPFYWGMKGEALKPRNVKKVAHGGGHIMIWGCMTAGGVGFMARIEGNMNADLYTQILGDELLRSLKYHHLNPSDIIFQQDNDSKHTSKLADRWFSAHGMEVMEWPAHSPDINPIENLWAHIKARLNDFDEPPTSAAELWDRVQGIWDNIDPDLCRRLVESMPERIQAVLKAKGGWTRY